MNNIKYWLVVIGGVLILYGLTQRSLRGATFIWSGGYLVYCGLIGQLPFNRKERARLEAGYRSRSEQISQRSPDRTIDPEDIVDVAAWASFPASDPPAWTPVG